MINNGDDIRILIADDHSIVREGLLAIIAGQDGMAAVGVAVNGREAVDAWSRYRPDVALFDLRMPVLDGVAAVQEIRRQHPGAKIIILTTFDTDNDVARAMKAGAKGYLLKDAPREEIFDCIRKVHHGDVHVSAGLVAKLADGLRNEELTQRELDVLKLLALGKNNRDIGSSLYVEESTVKSHLRRIFTKLHVVSRTEAICLAIRRGLVE
ncbi:response regulator transcription factor [Rugamonas sp.]|uniref:response regulator transcription factor n=1 Tax=Rugamonas sp. TaxID=1926287 RepID=UPI0025F3FE30|nr:response regulator transcription factor [Rugamonas sp.]